MLFFFSFHLPLIKLNRFDDKSDCDNKVTDGVMGLTMWYVYV